MHIELVIAKLVTMGLGFLIAWQAYRGYRVHGSEPMLFLALGFTLISFGAVIEGVLFDVIGLSIFHAGAVQTGVVAVGMAVILYSLYGLGPSTDASTGGPPDIDGDVTNRDADVASVDGETTGGDGTGGSDSDDW